MKLDESQISKNKIEIKLIEVNPIIDMSYMFYNCNLLESLPDISEWNTKKVTNMSSMFYRCSSLKSLLNIDKWDTKNVTDMSEMFSYCSSLEYLPDISKWDTTNVENLEVESMFYNCIKLKSSPLLKNT